MGKASKVDNTFKQHKTMLTLMELSGLSTKTEGLRQGLCDCPNHPPIVTSYPPPAVKPASVLRGLGVEEVYHIQRCDDFMSHTHTHLSCFVPIYKNIGKIHNYLSNLSPLYR